MCQSLVAAGPASAATIDTSAWYVLVNRNSGKVVDVLDRATADGAPIAQWARNDGAWQQWQFVDSGGGYYRLRSRHSGKVVDIYNHSTADGAQVVQYTDLNGGNQQFRVVDTDNGHVKLINRTSGKALEVWERSTADGARVSQYTDLNGTNQQWQLVKLGGTDPVPGDAKQMEDLDRGLISVRSGSGNLVSWRLLGTESRDTTFNVYRGGTLVAGVTNSTNYLDPGASADASYTVRAVVGGSEQADSETSLRFGNGYLDVPISPPSGNHTAGDASTGDLDGGRQAGPGAQVGAQRRQGQLPVRDHQPGLHRRDQTRRHPAVADQPGPQHPRRRPLHPVPGVRLRWRRPGRGGDEDRRRHGRRPRRHHRQRERQPRQLLRLHPGRSRVPDDVQRPDRRRDVDRQLRAGARHRLLLGRQLRQPGGPVPGGHRLPGRPAAEPDHGTRLLHPVGHRRLGLPQRLAHPPLDVRLQLLGQRRLRRAGQPPAVHRRRGRRRQAGDRLRLGHDRRQRRPACTAPASGTATRCTWAT
ncbi:hypothetical protein GCM10018952_71140 [Streptosporangium vulgare]